jgi:transcriptional regulator with XRE-family HTH domain
MARSFDELRKRMSPERRERNKAKTAELLKSLPLQELRAARRYSQQQLAEILNVQQAAVSKIERRTDIYISTLRRYIEAMGGALVIRAQFPEGEVSIDLFGEIDKDAPDERS